LTYCYFERALDKYAKVFAPPYGSAVNWWEALVENPDGEDRKTREEGRELRMGNGGGGGHIGSMGRLAAVGDQTT
jgi:hypothetical protein